MRNEKAVSVVICTRDRPRFAEGAISSILEGSLAPREIVVVDQSEEPSADLCELGVRAGVPVRHVPTRTRGLSAARNLGAAAAREQIIAFSDDDVVVASSWLATLVAALDAGGVRCVVTGRVMPGEPEVHGGFVPATALGENPVVYRGRLTRDVLAGGNMAIHRATLAAVGGFDERLGAGSAFPSAEDNDLGLRLLDSGFAIVYVPDGVVVHRAWRGGREYPLARWRYGLGKGGFYAKHAWGRGAYGLRRAGRDVAKRPVRALVTVARRPRFALGELTYAAGVVVGFVKWNMRSY